MYNTQYFTMSGISFMIKFTNVTFEKHFNKFKCNINMVENKSQIDKLIDIERNILLKQTFNKTPSFLIKNQLEKNNIKIQPYNNRINLQKYKEFHIIIKISGIWCDDLHYGLTYKFTIPN